MASYFSSDSQGTVVCNQDSSGSQNSVDTAGTFTQTCSQQIVMLNLTEKALSSSNLNATFKYIYIYIFSL